MLGSEYNWLIESFRQADGLHNVRLARGGLFTLVVAAFCLLCLTLRAAPPAAAAAAPHPVSTLHAPSH